MTNSKFALVAVSLAVLSLNGWTVEPFTRTPQEEALCSTLIYGGQSPEAKRTAEGDDWIHMHHYCDCIRYRYRALRKIADKPAFNYDLGVAIGACDYVITHTNPSFYMRPKVLVDKGRALRLRGDFGAALRDFQLAITMNSHEISAYLESAQVQKDLGRSDEALKTLYSGLQANPGNKVLEQRYRESGGKERLPEPVGTAGLEVPKSPAGPVEGPKMEIEKSEIKLEPPGPANPGEAVEGAGGISTKGCRYCPPDAVQRKWEDSFKRDGG